MNIIFDYCRLSRSDRAEISVLDPTKGDYAITEDDFEFIRKDADKFKLLTTVLDRHRPKFPYIIKAPVGETYYLSDKMPSTREGSYCYNIFDKDGNNVGWIPLDQNGAMIRPAIAASLDTLFNIMDSDKSMEDVLRLFGFLDKHIFPNTFDMPIDRTPPKYPDKNMLINAGVKDRVLSGVIVNNGIKLSIPSFGESMSGDAKYTLITNSSIIPLDGKKFVYIPKDEEILYLRATDTHGNASDLTFTKLIIEDRVYFIQNVTDEKLQKQLFRQYLKQLTEKGYTIKFSLEPSNNPLKDLLKKCSAEIFSNEGDTSEPIEVSYLFARSFKTKVNKFKSDTIGLVSNWLSDDKPLPVGVVYRNGIKGQVILNSTKGILNTSINASSRNAPLILTRGSQKVKIDHNFQDADFIFNTLPDVSWAKTKHDIGYGNKKFVVKRTGEELEDSPIRINGQLESIAINLSIPFFIPSDFETHKIEVYGKKTDLMMYEDKYGNIIVFKSNRQTLIIIPKIPEEHCLLSVDLTPFGLSELKDLVEIQLAPPIARLGKHGEYGFYASNAGYADLLADFTQGISQAETDFGFNPGTVIKRIYADTISLNTAGVTMVNPHVIWMNGNLISQGVVKKPSGYHETIHSLDKKIKISKFKIFKDFWENVKKKNPEFLNWISERNFIPHAIGGHAIDDPGEFLCSLLCTQFNPHLKECLAQNDPKFVAIYRQALILLSTILGTLKEKGEISPKAPVFQVIDKLLRASEDISYETPVEFPHAKEYKKWEKDEKD